MLKQGWMLKSQDLSTFSELWISSWRDAVCWQITERSFVSVWQWPWVKRRDAGHTDYLIKQDEEYVKCRQVILYFIQRNHVNNQYRPSWPPVQMEESINWANKESKAATTMGLRTDYNKVKDTCFKQVGDCETRIADLSEQLSSLHRKLARLCEKKQKGKE